jgi:hypothetical protein
MMKARSAKEIVLRMPNAIGTLNTVAKALSDAGVNMLALSAWVEGDHVVLRLLADDTVRASDLLRAQKHAVRVVDVVVTDVPHKPGMLRHVTEQLAKDEIDIHHLYVTAAAGQEHALVVFATANNDRAIVRLNAAAGAPDPPRPK